MSCTQTAVKIKPLRGSNKRNHNAPVPILSDFHYDVLIASN